MSELEDYDRLLEMLKKYDSRHPSEGAKGLIDEIKHKRDERMKEYIL